MSVTQSTIRVVASGDNFSSEPISVEQFVIRNECKNMVLTMVSYGASITSCLVGGSEKDSEESLHEVALCYPLEKLINDPGPYFGATVGRVANRTCCGKFELDNSDGDSGSSSGSDKTPYTLAVNNGENHLHGGIVGLDKRNWDFELVDTPYEIGVKFTYDSPDGEEGYPGNVQIEATYTLSRHCQNLLITFRAKTDHMTPLNLTNHTYWNLSGDNFCRDVKQHALYLNCDQYLPVTDTQIPTGEYANVNGTSFDFRGKRAPSRVNMPVPPLLPDSAQVSTSPPIVPIVTETKTETETEFNGQIERELTPEELTKETDAEFIARMEREEAVAFAAAVASWRTERANGGGKAVIVETGGAFELPTSVAAAGGARAGAYVPVTLLSESIACIDGGGQPGLDHCFLVNQPEPLETQQEQTSIGKTDSSRPGLPLAAVLLDPGSGRTMTCRTSQPGVQVYTANWLPPRPPSGADAGDGVAVPPVTTTSTHPFTQHNAVCLETQGLPDAVNQSHFPSILLHPEETYLHSTEFSFSTTL